MEESKICKKTGLQNFSQSSATRHQEQACSTTQKIDRSASRNLSDGSLMCDKHEPRIKREKLGKIAQFSINDPERAEE